MSVIYDAETSKQVTIREDLVTLSSLANEFNLDPFSIYLEQIPTTSYTTAKRRRTNPKTLKPYHVSRGLLGFKLSRRGDWFIFGDRQVPKVTPGDEMADEEVVLHETNQLHPGHPRHRNTSFNHIKVQEQHYYMTPPPSTKSSPKKEGSAHSLGELASSVQDEEGEDDGDVSYDEQGDENDIIVITGDLPPPVYPILSSSDDISPETLAHFLAALSNPVYANPSLWSSIVNNTSISSSNSHNGITPPLSDEPASSDTHCAAKALLQI